MTTLDRLPTGDRAVIESLDGSPALTQRLMELGVFEGETVEIIGVAPMGDPIEIRLGNTRLSLRRAEAAFVRVRPL